MSRMSTVQLREVQRLLKGFRVLPFSVFICSESVLVDSEGGRGGEGKGSHTGPIVNVHLAPQNNQTQAMVNAIFDLFSH